MAALPDLRRKRGQGPALIVCALAAAYLATRIALTWRFPWFVDETTFASFAKDVHGNIDQFFIAESDRKGLLPSWLGAGLIGLGIEPVTALRLLSAAGAALAATCGGLIVRRLYGLREGLLTAGLVALGPFFLVSASVGIYDPLVTGFVTAAVLIALHLAERPRLPTAILLGAVIGAGCLTKPTAWAAAGVLPFTLLVLDRATPELRRRMLRWIGCALLALALAGALASIARLTSFSRVPLLHQNQRDLGQAIGVLRPELLVNSGWVLVALVGYLTPPGALLVVVGWVAAWRRRRGAAALLGIWAGAVIASVVLFAMANNPRYLATAVVPLAGFIAIGAFAVLDAIHRRWGRRPHLGRAVAAAAVLLAVLPAAFFDTRVLADPARAHYPGLDERQYVTFVGALGPLGQVAHAIEQGGGPFPVVIDTGPYPRSYYTNGPWGLDLLLNGAAVGRSRRYIVFFHGTPEQRAAARYLVSDGEHSDTPPRRGYRLILRIRRPDHGATMRLYERDPA